MFEGIAEVVGNIASGAGAAASSGMSGLQMSIPPPSAGPSMGDEAFTNFQTMAAQSWQGIQGGGSQGGGDFSTADHPTGKAFESSSGGGDGGQHQASNTSGAHAEHQGPAGEGGNGGGNSGSHGGGGEGGENFKPNDLSIGKSITKQAMHAVKKLERGVTAVAFNLAAIATGEHPRSFLEVGAKMATRAASRGIVALPSKLAALKRLLTGKA
jgi:hypothetical protein